MGYNKYQKLKKQYSFNGIIWSDVYPPEFQAGRLLQSNAPECGYIEPIYRWSIVADEFFCENFNKYKLLIYQVSKDEGRTWQNVEPEQSKKGELIEQNSVFCNYGITWQLVPNEYLCTDVSDLQYRFAPIENEYVCVGGDKHEKTVKQQSLDGVNWTTIVPEIYGTGKVIEKASNSCPQPNEFDFLFKSRYPSEVTVFAKKEQDNTYEIEMFNGSDIYHLCENYKYGFFLGSYIDLEGNKSASTNAEYIIDFKLDKYNTSNITNMDSMFASCSSLTSLDLSSFNTSNVVSMENMFNDCKSLLSLDLSSFDTSNVKSMYFMFESCKSLETVNLSSFDTSNVENMYFMFAYCYSLKYLNLSNFDFSKIKNLNTVSLLIYDNYLFGSGESESSMHPDVISYIEELIIHFNPPKDSVYSNWFFRNLIFLKSLKFVNSDTSNITDMSGFFYRCEKLTELDLSSFDTSNVVSMENMFNDCKSLTSLDLSSFDVSNVTSMDWMFLHVNNLNYIKCKQSFKDWCITNQDIIVLPKAMREGGSGQWDIVG